MSFCLNFLPLNVSHCCAQNFNTFFIGYLMHLMALNRGILMTPFHNMALMSPYTTMKDVDHHTKVFEECIQILLNNSKL